MSFDLQLNPLCVDYGSTSDLYGSNCKHMTLCFNCGKRMTQNRAKCSNCGTQITLLNWEADDDMSMSPVLPPKEDTHTPEEDPVDTPAIAAPSGGTPSTTSKSTNLKRKASEDDAKVANSAPLEKDSKSSAKERSASDFKGNNAIPSSGSASLSAKAPAHPYTGPVTEEEIRAVLSESGPLSTAGLVVVFRGKLKSEEDKRTFAAILKRISKIQKFNGANYVVLRDPSTGSFAEEEIRAVLSESAPLTAHGLIAEFRDRLKTKEDRNAFAAIVRRISKIQKVDKNKYVVLRDKNTVTSTDSTLSAAKAFPSSGCVSEEEIRAFLVQSAPLTAQELMAEFKGRLKLKEDIKAFGAILMRILKIQKVDKANYVVLRDDNAITSRGSTLSSAKASADPSPGCVTEEEVRAFLVQSAPLTAEELVAEFKGRLKLKEDKDTFLEILRGIVKSQKIDGADYVVLKDK